VEEAAPVDGTTVSAVAAGTVATAGTTGTAGTIATDAMRTGTIGARGTTTAAAAVQAVAAAGESLSHCSQFATFSILECVSSGTSLLIVNVPYPGSSLTYGIVASSYVLYPNVMSLGLPNLTWSRLENLRGIRAFVFLSHVRVYSDRDNRDYREFAGKLNERGGGL